MKKTLIITSILATICFTPAIARELTVTEQKTRWYFDRIDLNNDHFISPEEHSAFGEWMFDDADVNDDGMLSYSEFSAENKLEEQRFHEDFYGRHPVPKRLPNRVNTNPSDHSINKGQPKDMPNNRYLSK